MYVVSLVLGPEDGTLGMFAFLTPQVWSSASKELAPGGGPGCDWQSHALGLRMALVLTSSGESLLLSKIPFLVSKWEA